MYAMVTFRWLRRAAHVVVSAALLLTAVLPALDRDMVRTGQRIETEHSSSACGYTHDHMLCVQWAGTRLIAAAPRPDTTAGEVVGHQEPPTTEFALASTPRVRPGSRAPPTA